MNLKKKLVATGAALGIVIAGVGLAAPASAEPVSDGIAMAGSDTLQDVANALVNGSAITGATIRIKAAGNNVGSFDAFGSANIQTKESGRFFARPNGSGAGVTALQRSITGATAGNLLNNVNILGQVDIARSSSSAGANANANGDLAYIPFGKDALGYIYRVDAAWSQATKDAFGSLTAAQLKSIYDGDTTTIAGQTVLPRLPQTASGTRQTFLTKIGYASSAALPAGVPAGDNTTTGPAENDAAELTVPGEIIAFSVASWVAQANGAGSKNSTTTPNVAFGNADSLVPFTGTAPALVPAQAYYNSNWGRDTFLVVEYARTQPTLPGTSTPNPRYDAALATLVNPAGGNSSLVSTQAGPPTAPGTLKRAYGFLAPTSSTVVRSHADVYPNSVWPGN